MQLELRRQQRLNDFLNALRRITQAIRLSSSQAQDTLGITGAQLFVLQQLAERPAASLRELAARTLTDQSSVSVVVSRLVAGGLVTRRIAPGDHRRVELALTANGRLLLRRAPELAQSRLVACLEGLPVRELEVAGRVLVQLAEAVGGPAGAPAMFFEPPKPRRARRRAGRARSDRGARS